MVEYAPAQTVLFAAVRCCRRCVGAVFVCLAVPVSILDIGQHLANYYSPNLQRYVIRIIAMVHAHARAAVLARVCVRAGVRAESCVV